MKLVTFRLKDGTSYTTTLTLSDLSQLKINIADPDIKWLICNDKYIVDKDDLQSIEINDV